MVQIGINRWFMTYTYPDYSEYVPLNKHTYYHVICNTYEQYAYYMPPYICTYVPMNYLSIRYV